MQKVSNERSGGFRSYSDEECTNREGRCYDNSHCKTKGPNVEFHVLARRVSS